MPTIKVWRDIVRDKRDWRALSDGTRPWLYEPDACLLMHAGLPVNIFRLDGGGALAVTLLAPRTDVVDAMRNPSFDLFMADVRLGFRGLPPMLNPGIRGGQSSMPPVHAHPQDDQPWHVRDYFQLAGHWFNDTHHGYSPGYEEGRPENYVTFAEARAYAEDFASLVALRHFPDGLPPPPQLQD